MNRRYFALWLADTTIIICEKWDFTYVAQYELLVYFAKNCQYRINFESPDFPQFFWRICEKWVFLQPWKAHFMGWIFARERFCNCAQIICEELESRNGLDMRWLRFLRRQDYPHLIKKKYGICEKWVSLTCSRLRYSDIEISLDRTKGERDCANISRIECLSNIPIE